MTLKLVAQYGDMWHAFGDAEAYKKKNEILLRHCQDVGRDVRDRAHLGHPRPTTSEEADALVEAGVQHLIVGIGGDGSGYDLAALRELAAWRDRATRRRRSDAAAQRRTSTSGPSVPGRAWPLSASVRSNSPSSARSTERTPSSPASARPHK